VLDARKRRNLFDFRKLDRYFSVIADRLIALYSVVRPPSGDRYSYVMRPLSSSVEDGDSFTVTNGLFGSWFLVRPEFASLELSHSTL